MRRIRRLGLLVLTGAFAAGAPGAMAAFSPADSDYEVAYRRAEADDENRLALGDDLDADPDSTNSGTNSENATTTVFAATRTGNDDGDGTRGNDGTTNGNTITRNRDGDDTRGNDGTSDGDNTRGQDGTGGGDNSRSASGYSSRD